MDYIALLAIGILAAVALEFIGYKAYRRYRAMRESRLDRGRSPLLYSSLAEVIDYLGNAQRYLEDVIAGYKGGRSASGIADDDQLCLAEGMRAGKEAQLSIVREYADKLGLDCPYPKAAARLPHAGGSAGAASTADVPAAPSLGAYGDAARRWSSDTFPVILNCIKGEGHRAIAKKLYPIGSVEASYAELVSAMQAGQEDTDHEVSSCPSCGSIYFGRRPAFCLVCNNPGFDMNSLRTGLL